MLRHPETGEIGYEIIVGGGLGRTPMIGKVIRDFLPKDELLAYLEAVMRVYNAEGRRDNKYKARVKILVHEIGTDEFKARVEAEYAELNGPTINAPRQRSSGSPATSRPRLRDAARDVAGARRRRARPIPSSTASWSRTAFPHRQPGYIALTVSLKPIGGVPGDMSDAEMRAFADIASAIRSTSSASRTSRTSCCRT